MTASAGQRVQFGDASCSWSLGQWGGLPKQGGACDRGGRVGGPDVAGGAAALFAHRDRSPAAAGGERRRAGVPASRSSRCAPVLRWMLGGRQARCARGFGRRRGAGWPRAAPRGRRGPRRGSCRRERAAEGLHRLHGVKWLGFRKSREQQRLGRAGPGRGSGLQVRSGAAHPAGRPASAEREALAVSTLGAGLRGTQTCRATCWPSQRRCACPQPARSPVWGWPSESTA